MKIQYYTKVQSMPISDDESSQERVEKTELWAIVQEVLSPVNFLPLTLRSGDSDEIVSIKAVSYVFVAVQFDGHRGPELEGDVDFCIGIVDYKGVLYPIEPIGDSLGFEVID